MKKAGRIFSFLLVLLFLLQFMPFGTEVLSARMEDTGISHIADRINPENIFITHENGISLSKLTVSRLQLPFISEAGGGLYDNASLLRREAVIDIREIIRSAISEYFYGGKYRDIDLLITKIDVEFGGM